ncbi:MAG: ribose ABC transporter permease [Methylocapsa sp.]|nr:ribose ABC transporter permease [Methylocapsa sp.]
MEIRLADEARFFMSWLDNPGLAGAVSPSGPFLARMMARYVDPKKAGPVVELGPGTGAITEALLERGIAPRRLYLIEFDGGFCSLLRRRFPGVHVIRGDAYQLTKTIEGRLRRAPAAVVSSLPLLLKPESIRLALLAQAMDTMAADGRFIQFTYSPLAPIPRDKVNELDFQIEASSPVWLNFPPARVWVYRRFTQADFGLTRKRPNPAQEFFEKIKLGTEKVHFELAKEFSAAKERLIAGNSELSRKKGARGGPDFGRARKASTSGRNSRYLG